MIRHGIVVPGTGPPQQCGGPAFCAICNAEMIELETIAIGCAEKYERRMGRGLDDPGMLTRRWQHSSYANQYRESARQLIRHKIKSAAAIKTRRAEYDRKRRRDEEIVAHRNELQRIRRAKASAKAVRAAYEQRLREQRRAPLANAT